MTPRGSIVAEIRIIGARLTIQLTFQRTVVHPTKFFGYMPPVSYNAAALYDLDYISQCHRPMLVQRNPEPKLQNNPLLLKNA